MSIEEKRTKYQKLLHAMQTGVQMKKTIDLGSSEYDDIYQITTGLRYLLQEVK